MHSEKPILNKNEKWLLNHGYDFNLMMLLRTNRTFEDIVFIESSTSFFYLKFIRVSWFNNMRVPNAFNRLNKINILKIWK